MSWIWPVVAGLFASTASLMASAALLLLGNKAERVSGWVLPFALGTMLGAALLGLLPEALEIASNEQVLGRLLCGILAFTVLERLLHWRHPHHPDEPHVHVRHATATMVLWGDALHSLTDGLVIGVSFNSSFELGVSTTLAVLVHELPQEVGDLAILLSAGIPKRRAVLLNFCSALAIIPGAFIAYWWASSAQPVAAWLLPIAAGGFLYIALASLVPALHHRRGPVAVLLQILLIGAGVATLSLLRGL